MLTRIATLEDKLMFPIEDIKMMDITEVYSDTTWVFAKGKKCGSWILVDSDDPLVLQDDFNLVIFCKWKANISH